MIRAMLLVAVLLSHPAHAQTPQPEQASKPTVLLPGAASCSDWSAARRGEGKYSWHGDVTWFRGFIAGHNTYVRPPANQRVSADANDVALWLDTYCQKNPTSILAQAATAYAAAHGGGSDPLSEARTK